MVMRPGNIIKVTRNGQSVAAQFVLKRESVGDLLRVFPGLRDPDSEADFRCEWSQESEQFYIYMSLASAVRAGMAEVVGHAEVPKTPDIDDIIIESVNAAGLIARVREGWSGDD